jgi:hypothetical protein
MSICPPTNPSTTQSAIAVAVHSSSYRNCLYHNLTAAELTLLNPPIHWHSTLSSHTTFILFHELQITAVEDI